MIQLIVVKEHNETTGKEELIVSHGVDLETLKVVVLPQISPHSVGAVLRPDLGWVIP